ncbi:MAG: hypothetical protein JXB15_02595 [Anaerolineales bacterium]|nr:hypothetical protein [Anaerolineales bacterium]
MSLDEPTSGLTPRAWVGIISPWYVYVVLYLVLSTVLLWANIRLVKS